MCSKKNDASEGSLSCTEHMGKICIVCNQDCSSEPRYKDVDGRYTCKKCYFEEALQGASNTTTGNTKGTLPTKSASSRVKVSSSKTPATKYLQVFGIGLLGVGLEIGATLSESIGLMVLAFLYILSCNLVIADRLGASNPILQLIPIVNIFHLCGCADLPMWMSVLFFIPFVNIVFIVYLYCRISNHLDKPTWLGVFILVPLANTFLLGYLVSAESLKK